jgi:hypothetical protein
VWEKDAANKSATVNFGVVGGAYRGRDGLPDPEGQESSLYELQSMRDGKAENNSLVADLLGGSSGNRDGLGIDHFAHDSQRCLPGTLFPLLGNNRQDFGLPSSNPVIELAAILRRSP